MRLRTALRAGIGVLRDRGQARGDAPIPPLPVSGRLTFWKVHYRPSELRGYRRIP